MKIHLYIALLKESFRFALQNISANILRTLLSLIGVTIGVFCIIGILTFVDSLEYNVRASISKFGDNLLFVQKYPWASGSEGSWREYMKRPNITYAQMQQLKKRVKLADAVAYNFWVNGEKLKAENETVENITIRAVSYDYQKAMDIDFEKGRYFTEAEAENGGAVILLGYDLANALFKSPEQALDQKIRVMGRNVLVIGVLEKQGNSLNMGPNQDMAATVPANFIRSLGSFENESFNTTVLIKGAANVDTDKLESEVEGVMRSIRRLDPRDDDDFAINRITILSSIISKITSTISLYGWIIAGFSILVGGFGIANIMFVSVKERTSIIGIQKALGAKQYFILIQFLFEAILLCIFGGLIGLLLVFLISQAVNIVSPLQIVMSLKNVIIGMGISTIIGLLAGIIPSYQAAKMDPIEAIRFNM